MVCLPSSPSDQHRQLRGEARGNFPSTLLVEPTNHSVLQLSLSHLHKFHQPRFARWIQLGSSIATSGIQWVGKICRRSEVSYKFDRSVSRLKKCKFLRFWRVPCPKKGETTHSRFPARLTAYDAYIYISG